MENFYNEMATSFAESINEAVAVVILDEINNKIDLDSIIANDKVERKKAFDLAYEDCKDEDIRKLMIHKDFEFSTTNEKLEYGFKALLDKGYTFTHDIDNKGILKISFFKLDTTVAYGIFPTYNVEIKQD